MTAPVQQQSLPLTTMTTYPVNVRIITSRPSTLLTATRYPQSRPQPRKPTSTISSRMSLSFIFVSFSLHSHQVLWKVCYPIIQTSLLFIQRALCRISSIDYLEDKGTAVIHFEKPSAAKTASMVSSNDHTPWRNSYTLSVERWHFGWCQSIRHF
jgi:hypothetical protein